MARSRSSVSRSRTAVPAALGSLTQQASTHACRRCGSNRVTRLAMHLTDGTPVVFVSCHRCEERSWEHDGMELTRDDVLARTRKLA